MVVEDEPPAGASPAAAHEDAAMLATDREGGDDMTEREPVTLHLPSWLLDDVHDVLEERAGRLEDGELEAALQEHVERFLDRATSSPHGPEATDLVDALRAVRRVGWSKQKAVASAHATAR